MNHDEQCELDRVTHMGPTCHCGARAYARDPLEDLEPPPEECVTPGVYFWTGTGA